MSIKVQQPTEHHLKALPGNHLGLFSDAQSTNRRFLRVFVPASGRDRMINTPYLRLRRRSHFLQPLFGDFQRIQFPQGRAEELQRYEP